MSDNHIDQATQSGENPTDAEMLQMASVFELELEYDAKTTIVLRIERRAAHGGRNWAVVDAQSKFLLTQDGMWVYDPVLGSDPDFLANTRWDDALSAIKSARIAINNARIAIDNFNTN